MSPLLAISDVAKLLNVSKITIRRKVAAGELPVIRLSPGGPLRFSMADLEKFVERHRD
jgi:excisionase family DNA binding protein